MRYQLYSYWNYVDSTTLITYDASGDHPITKATKYCYDNEEHSLLSRTITIDSKGDEITSVTYYPEDYTTGVANFEELIENRLLTALPIDQRTYRNGLLTNDKLTKYNDFGQPHEIYLSEAELGSAHPFDPNNPYTFGVRRMKMEYDNNLNLVSYNAEHDIPTIFIWGYNYAFPVAKIQNSSHSEIEANLGCTYEQLQVKTNTELLTLFNDLRNSLPLAFITSYTYDPIIGIKTETDPNGNTIYYEYDNYGRLETIRNQDDYIIKHIEYNYVNLE
jgi:YD repeat-containing protein